MSNELDLHKVRHEDVDILIENFVLLNIPPLTIITGNSEFMRKSVIDKCKQFNLVCEQWDSGMIKVLGYTDD
tara:strand:+ start:184 stop:399 length:216 start_codon:yes stop_codon:yes gene_type:complete